MHEPAQLFDLWKPHDRMHMIRHDDKSNALCRLPLPLCIQLAQQDTLGLILVQQPPPTITRKRDKVAVQMIVSDAAIVRHVLIF
ncbi:hypothetical protein Mal4_20110 [Maioricimonas rarisocia]|uniref:Uncharacterized protein n=1 Tax=Maioricimonas rarisocia TaxID=2528026 RepID=A0A517Z5E9_9PLAN|nr:hypothetical protein Mal4_20110 [Maioricimonas rarisocia]